MVRFSPYLMCWSVWAFSILLSLARLFWNQILICVSESWSLSASSHRLGLEMYSVPLYSTSSTAVCSWLKVVLCLRALASLRARLATKMMRQ